MNIQITIIDHKAQRYDTVGDWQFPQGDKTHDLQINVSDLGDWRYNLLVAVHELVEAALCKHRGISQEAVDQFDMYFAGEGEPGAAENCPYRLEHIYASVIERDMAWQLDVDWGVYEAAIEALDQ